MALPSKRTSADFTFKHTGQVDEYGASVGDASIVQANFDQRAIDNMTAINNLIDALSATADGASGADSIGMTAITGLSGTTIQAVVESLKSLVDANELDIETKVTNLETKVDNNETDIETKVTNLETKVDNNETDIEGKVTALKGTGYVDETVKGNAEDLVTLENKVDTNESDIEGKVTNLKGVGYSGETVRGNAEDLVTLESKVDSNELDIENKVTDLKGTGYTNQTVKDNYDRIISNDNDISNLQSDKADKTSVYTKTELQTSGSSLVHWENLTNIPAFGDNSWKAPVATLGDLPDTGNTNGDLRIVLDDDTVYTWDEPTGAWKEIGATGNNITDHGTLQGLGDDDHAQYLRTDGTRKATGNLDLDGNQLVNVVVHNEATLPAGTNGQVIYHTTEDKLKLKIPSGWVTISGQGAIIREVEITASGDQSVFDVGQGGLYQYSTNSGVMNVYKKNAEGYYELLDKDDYVETDSETITLDNPVTDGTEMYFKWQYNLASIASAIEDNSITNNKLVADIKIGSLANLTTTEKSNVVGAINEVDSNVDSHISNYNVHGDTSTLERSGKDSEGLFTTLIWKRPDGTKYKQSVLSGGTTPEYTTRTVTYYDTDGSTVLDTVSYTLSYDIDGDLISEVIS